ncbi:unnamed protein product [Rhizophagus irregularis]|uniref:Uncharacterized protein n=1 Tax=Rhizophagus irregularis TaxID=588596 RepID=A0A2N1NC73_9GLOM|nr:hypothetical protein RhiirC2_865582 [Rhizophagus irregularis]CAB4391443.1 unnamed protein product [Rhizophagus irregularis]CAB5381287.1 unnamed protein product [Rhizophagus irregularis]
MAINKCCYCIPLRIGVIIISIIWILFGAYQTAKGIASLAIAIPNNGVFSVGLFQNLRAFIIVSVILYALVTIGAAFGLIVVLCAHKPRKLEIYAKIAYIIAAIQIISNIIDIAAVALLNKEMKKMCSQFPQGFSSTANQFANYATDTCSSTINNISSASLAYVIIIAIIVTIFVVYFAIVISAYARKKREQEDADKTNNPPYY